MSALLRESPAFRPMGRGDLDAVFAVEQEVYPFPWTRGNFSDSLQAGYSCWVCEMDRVLAGYGVMMLAAGEAHLLNVAVSAKWQGRGMGHRLMRHLIGVAREYHAEFMFLEVRPSNLPARRLYGDLGFSEIAVRKNYYPACKGREDAIIMGLPL